MNVDLILIGRRFGAEALGHFQNARALTDEIRARIAIPMQSVLFPAFASVQACPERGSAMLLRSGRILAAIVVPIGIGVAATAPELVPVLYGDQWHSMTPLLSVLGVTAAIKASTAIATPVINAHDKVSVGLRYQAVSTFLTVVAIVLTLPYGVDAVATSILAVSAYSLLPYRFGLSLLGMGWREAWLMLGPPFLASATFWGAILVARAVVHVSHPVQALALHGLIAATAYPITLLLISRAYLQDLHYLTKKISARRVVAR